MSQQVNVRLPKLTRDQIDELSQTHGLTKTQVVILAIDRLSQALDSESQEAHKDLRRLKTVARIAPHLDLGQDE